MGENKYINSKELFKKNPEIREDINHAFVRILKEVEVMVDQYKNGVYKRSPDRDSICNLFTGYEGMKYPEIFLGAHLALTVLTSPDVDPDNKIINAILSAKEATKLIKKPDFDIKP